MTDRSPENRITLAFLARLAAILALIASLVIIGQVLVQAHA